MRLLYLLLVFAGICILSESRSVVPQQRPLSALEVNSTQVRCSSSSHGYLYSWPFLENMFISPFIYRLLLELQLYFPCSECRKMFVYGGHKDQLLFPPIHTRQDQSFLWRCLWKSGSVYWWKWFIVLSNWCNSGCLNSFGDDPFVIVVIIIVFNGRLKWDLVVLNRDMMIWLELLPWPAFN